MNHREVSSPALVWSTPCRHIEFMFSVVRFTESRVYLDLCLYYYSIYTRVTFKRRIQCYICVSVHAYVYVCMCVCVCVYAYIYTQGSDMDF